jgi:hypothetical protein
VTWPSNLTGGSTASTFSSSGFTSNLGTYFPNGGSVSYTINVTSGLPGITGTAYLYPILALGRWVGWNADGSPNVVYDISYPMWGSSQQTGVVNYINGPGGRGNYAYTISNMLYITACLRTKAAYNNTTDIRMSTSLNGGNLGLSFDAAFSTTQTITFTNYSGTDYYIGSFSGANGHWTPLEFGYYAGSTWTISAAQIDNTAQTVYGRYLITSLTINGTAVSYTAPNGAAINAAGISGVSAVDQTNGLGIIGATSVTSAATSTVGSSNYTPSIGSYGAF